MKNALVAIVTVLVMIIGGVPLFTTQSHMTPALVSVSVTSTNETEGYTHQVYSGEFSEVDTPVSTESVRVENVMTDWGKFGLDKGDLAGKTFSQLSWGSTAITCHARYYDLYLDYWYYNGTGVAGRPFASRWGNFYELRNDSYVGVWQYSANAKSSFSGAADVWNATVRFTVLKQEPYIKVDVWIRYLNLSQPIKRMDVKPCYYEGGTEYTANYDLGRRMAYRVANDGSYAVGHVSHQPKITYGNVYCAMGMYTQNRTQKLLTEDWHMSSVIMVGQDLADLRDKADRLNDEWFTEYDRTDTNLVVAYNDERIDCLRYFSDDGYTYVPTAANETVIAGGILTAHEYTPNPVLSYSKIPVVTDIDDSYLGYGVNANWDWYYNQSEIYGIATTFPTEWAYVLPSYMSSLLNLSEKREGTLYEMAEHGWNHTSMYDYQTLAYQYNIWELSEQRWEANSSFELLSVAFPGNAWSYVTFEAMGLGDALNIRGNVLGNEYLAPMDFDFGGGTVFIAGFTDLYTYSTDLSAALEQKGNAYGYLFHQGHIADFDTGTERETVFSYWQYLQNNSQTFNSVTHAQWSDLYHHRVSCYDQDGMFTVDLSDATVNHRLQVGPTDGGLPLFWDLTADAAVTVESTTPAESILYAQKGHVYKAVAAVDIADDALGIVSLIGYDNDTMDPLATISANLTDGDLTIQFYGLDSSGSFQVSVDGGVDESLLYVSDDGTLTYTYTGAWSTHTFTVEPSYMTHLTGLFGAVMTVVVITTIMMAVIGLVVGASRKK